MQASAHFAFLIQCDLNWNLGDADNLKTRHEHICVADNVVFLRIPLGVALESLSYVHLMRIHVRSVAAIYLRLALLDPA
jgi:hypothetical protein